MTLERFGMLKLTKHEQLDFLHLEKGHPVQFFATPVALVLNYAEAFNYDAVHMIGLSGGGWTTTLYAALDPRIMRSYPVAGTRPFYLRSEPATSNSWGDYEDTVPELYEISNYLELYIMGSSGEGRKQLQIVNQFDPCCFEGIVYRTYEHEVQSRVELLGAGEFAVYLDSSHLLHQISTEALATILDDLEE